MIKGKSMRSPMVRGRFYMFVVKVPAVEGLPKRDAMQYVRDAVRCYAGGGHPEDPLFYEAREIVVKNTLYEMEKDTLMNLRKEIARELGGHETYAGEHAEKVDSIIDRYLRGM